MDVSVAPVSPTQPQAAGPEAAFADAQRLLALGDQGRGAFGRLTALRARLAKEARVPGFRILSNRQILLLAEIMPEEVDDLALVPGLSHLTVRAYGAEIVAACRPASLS